MAVGCHKKAFDHPISRLHSRSFNFRLLFRHKYGYWIQFFCLLFQSKSKSDNICVKGEINELLKGGHYSILFLSVDFLVSFLAFCGLRVRHCPSQTYAPAMVIGDI